MQLRNERQKRDPKLGKKYIILIYKGIREEVQIPLSPPAEKQIELKPLKSYDFRGFFFLSHIKIFIHT